MDAVAMLVRPEERALVRAKAFRMTGCARVWATDAGQSPRSAVCERLSLLVSAMAPDVPVDRLLLLVRYALWTIALDDRLDDPAIGEAQLARMRRRLSRAIERRVRGDGGVERFPTGYGGGPRGGYLRTELARLLTGFRAYDPGGALADRMARAVCEAVDAGLEIRRIARLAAARRSSRPSVTEYLSLAARDVNYRSFAWGLLILVGERPGWRVAQDIEAALDSAGTAVRLANDLRSVDRDAADGRFNVLTMPTGAGRVPSVADVEVRIAELVQEHREAIRKACEPGATRCAEALERCLDLSVGVYRVGDLR